MRTNGGMVKVDEKQLARGLGWFSIGLGLAQILAPRQLARMIGVRERPILFRLIGLREVASGIGIFSKARPAEWVQSRVAGDMMDLTLLAAALGLNTSTRGRVAVATAAVEGVTALDVLCAQQLSSGPNGKPGAIHVEKVVTINRSPEELYSFWRNFENLPRIMNHLVSVKNLDDKRSHWVVKSPGGTTVEWDAEMTMEKPNELIGWRSLEGAQVDNSGSVRFERAPGGRGTVVRVQLDYRPPAGVIGATLAKFFGEAPEKQVAVDLHRFKQLIETGEIPRTEGQPAGRSRSTSRVYDDFVRG